MSFIKWLTLIPIVLIAVGLGYTVLSLLETSSGLQTAVEQNIDTSGVSNPVTAVLLNFRGYDTMLEMVVLLVALIAVLSFETPSTNKKVAPNTVLSILTAILVPLSILVASYLLWVGAYAPGGAFQAGSVLGAAGVLLLLSGHKLFYGFNHLFMR